MDEEKYKEVRTKTLFFIFGVIREQKNLDSKIVIKDIVYNIQYTMFNFLPSCGPAPYEYHPV